MILIICYIFYRETIQLNKLFELFKLLRSFRNLALSWYLVHSNYQVRYNYQILPYCRDSNEVWFIAVFKENDPVKYICGLRRIKERYLNKELCKDLEKAIVRSVAYRRVAGSTVDQPIFRLA